MAIDIDTTHPLRRPLELQQLVEAVVTAGSADEAFWVECKNNDFDLTKAEGRFNLARVILSFANRIPDTASTVCGGLAYVIIGAEPGKVDGTKLIDGADLDNWLIKYLGGDGPVWSPTYVKHGDKNVLVIVVEAPKWGDRMHSLRQQLGGAQPGTIYVRSQSVSRQANPDELRLLEERLLRGQAAPEIDGLQVGYTIGPPDDRDWSPEDIARWPRAVLILDFTPEQVDEWIEERRAAIRDHHQAVIDAWERPKSVMAAMLTQPSINEKAIEEHLEDCRHKLFDASRRALIAEGLSLLKMSVTNPGKRTFEHVELTLTIDTPFSAFEQGHLPKQLDTLPAPPQPAKPTLIGYSGLAAAPFTPPTYITATGHHIPNQWLHIAESTVELKVGQLRPEKTRTSTDFHLFLHQRPPGEELTVGWTVTSTSTEGVQRGSIQVPVLAPPHAILVAPTKDLPTDSAAE